MNFCKCVGLVVSGAGSLTRWSLQSLEIVLVAWRTLKTHSVHYLKKKNRINVYGAPDLLLGSYKESSDSVYKTFEHLWKNKGNSDASGSF